MITELEDHSAKPRKAVLDTVDGKRMLSVLMLPPIHLLVGGGGRDATFMTSLLVAGLFSKSLGSEPAQARLEHFPEVNYGEDPSTEGLRLHMGEHNIQAAVLMSHHREIDAKALQV